MVLQSQPPPPLKAADGGLLYRVRKLLAVRKRSRGLQFLVDWEGYGPEEREWVSRKQIDDPSLISDFYAEQRNQPGPSGVGPYRGGTVIFHGYFCFLHIVLSLPVLF